MPIAHSEGASKYWEIKSKFCADVFNLTTRSSSKILKLFWQPLVAN